MARATRSSAQQDTEKQPEPPQPARKNANKKRKRNSIAGGDEQPLPKLPRTDEGIKEEDSQDPEEQQAEGTAEVNLPSSGDVPIQASDAEKILEILEVIDTQGLLDRVFPLPAELETPSSPSSSTATTPSASNMQSIRAILKDSSKYPLRVVRSAVQQLFPISSHPRSRPSAPAVEQMRFCQLALSLLNQASRHNAPVPLNVDSILSAHLSSSAEPSGSSDTKAGLKGVGTSQEEPKPRRKYALVQRLPNGDWWSSLNSSTLGDGEDITKIATGRAELAAILPSSTVPAGKTLGEYVVRKPSKLVASASSLSQPRRIPCGKFLDYGPYASFAPTFDQDGAEVGRVGLGEYVWQEERKWRLGELARQKRTALLEKQRQAAERNSGDAGTSNDPAHDAASANQTDTSSSDPDALEGLLSKEQIASLKSVLHDAELEKSVDELLERNARAMKQLEELQLQRLGSEGGGSSKVEVGSTEWELAQSICNSLTLLASLRPRVAGGESDHPPLIPTTSALRKLHRTLPVSDTGGWYGTLPPGRTIAVRDNKTLYVKAGVPAPTPAATTAPATTVPPVPVTPARPAATTATTPYSSYYGGQYRGGYGTYTPTQTSNYYANYPATQQTQTSTAPTATHYPNSQYNNNTATPSQYSYSSSWYNYQTPGQAATAAVGTTSGRGTPQPAAQPVAPGYSSYYQTQQPQPQRAVANTVLSPAGIKPSYSPANWPNGATTPGYNPPTLPPLRPVIPAAPTSTPSTPQPSGATSYYQNLQPAAR
ncbi:hypothetical protein K474DRAFT_1667917 [Panus rudis PR-1116 ss-1]|nr:hypothetical protein K474DRAFT_1667917 [Panus rudis PR-1116 ss-1]